VDKCRENIMFSSFSLAWVQSTKCRHDGEQSFTTNSDTRMHSQAEGCTWWAKKLHHFYCISFVWSQPILVLYSIHYRNFATGTCI